MRRRSVAAIAVATLSLAVLAACSTKSPSSDSSSSSPAQTSGASGASGSSTITSTEPLGQGVSATEIKIGIPFVDFSALKGVVDIDQGDFETSYKAVIDSVNAAGGINGRKLVATFAPINPTSQVTADAACTKFAQDDKVFAVMGFFYGQIPACYLITHGVNMVGSPATGADLSAAQQKQFKATWFSYTQTPAHSAKAVYSALNDAGAFTGEKVGMVADGLDSLNASAATAALKAVGVHVADSATNTESPTDLNAYFKQYKLIAQKFKSEGITAVVTIGASASNGWPKSLETNKSTYLPKIIAGDSSGLYSWQISAGAAADPILKGAISVTTTVGDIKTWEDPGFQKCVTTINAANPSTKIFAPTIENISKQPAPWASAEQACANTSLLTQIIKAAGPTLNNDTFLRAGESLKNITVPGSGQAGPMSFSAERHDGVSPLLLFTWNSSTNAFDTKVLS